MFMYFLQFGLRFYPKNGLILIFLYGLGSPHFRKKGAHRSASLPKRGPSSMRLSNQQKLWEEQLERMKVASFYILIYFDEKKKKEIFVRHFSKK